MTQRNVLVTGGAGFIGANLCRVLVGRGHNVSVLDDLSTGTLANLENLPAVKCHIGSILDRDTVNALVTDVDAVVHLAARPSVPRSIADPMKSHDVNVNGTMNVLEACRASAKSPHFMFASSSSVYGSNPVLPKHEDLVPMPKSPYAASKLAAESYALAYASSYRLAVLPFRFFNVYGPLQQAGHAYAAVVPAFVAAALAGQPLPVHGDGTQTRDFTYVDTVAAVISTAIEERICSDRPVNLAFGTRSSLLDVIERMGQIMGLSLTCEFQPIRAGDVRDSQADNTRLRGLFPNVVPVALEIGLRSVIDWMTDSLNDSVSAELS